MARASGWPDEVSSTTRRWPAARAASSSAASRRRPMPHRRAGGATHMRLISPPSGRGVTPPQATAASSRVVDQLGAQTWERLEEALIHADVGARTTAQVVERLEREAESGELGDGPALTNRLTELLAELATPEDPGSDRIDLRHEPTVL